MLKYPCLVLDHDDTVVQSEATVNYPFFCYILNQFRPGTKITLHEYTEGCFRLGFADMCRKWYNFTEQEIVDEYHGWQKYIVDHIPAPFPGIGDIIRRQKCSSNPLAFTQGGFYEGTKDPDDEVGDLVRYMTASFGITALDEATFLWTGKRLLEEGGAFSEEVLRHLQARINVFKKEDGWLYAIYGTPAESLCATQAKQYDAFCAKQGIDNVFRHTPHYSPEYFTNSFHVNVTEEITPFEKQDHEFKDFHLCEGGHIQYVRLDNPENTDAVKAVIERGMELGFYQGVNFDSAYCGDCGTHSTNVLMRCPKCGSSNLSVISRVCGYLGYSNVNGVSRMNEGKMAEIHNRKSM